MCWIIHKTGKVMNALIYQFEATEFSVSNGIYFCTYILYLSLSSLSAVTELRHPSRRDSLSRPAVVKCECESECEN